MIVSTRGRYALRVMIDLAEHAQEGFISVGDVAKRQGISEKYLQSILPILTENGWIEGKKGKGGGYRLKRLPYTYTVGEILRATEGNLAPVACLQEKVAPCERREACRTLAMWKEFHGLILAYFDSIRLESLMARQRFERRLDFSTLPEEMAEADVPR